MLGRRSRVVAVVVAVAALMAAPAGIIPAVGAEMPHAVVPPCHVAPAPAADDRMARVRF